MVAGAKGAVASTVAVAVAALCGRADTVLPSLTTAAKFPYLGPPERIVMTGWDKSARSLSESVAYHRVLEERIWASHEAELQGMPILKAPGAGSDLKSCVKQLTEEIEAFKKQYPGYLPVMINLLPASLRFDPGGCLTMSDLYSQCSPEVLPDMAYAVAALQTGVPLVNFTSNEVEIIPVSRLAIESSVPLCGRDGKTGQTYLKVVLASALKARSLFVDGWYSLNILGNSDGENLADPARAEGKLMNKTQLLDDILGYHVGERYNSASHKVRIDYYPPRGDAKEAWDVIDFMGLFGLPMSLRLNLQGRDSILAAPMVLDLARWMAALKKAGRSGPVGELGFFFKKPVGDYVAVTFQDQLKGLGELESLCDRSCAPDNKLTECDE